MGLQLELEKSLDENLKSNQIGARRRRRGGAEESEIEAARPAAKYGLSVVLKKAYDGVKTGMYAATQAGIAAALVAAADSSFRPDLCDPLAKSLASTMSVVPMAAAYVSRCDTAMTTYQAVLTSTILLVAPLLLNALKTAGSIFVSDETVDAVAEEFIEAAKNPAAAAAKAMTTRSKVKAEAEATQSKRRGGKRKTKKRSTRSRKTRRLTFSY